MSDELKEAYSNAEVVSEDQLEEFKSKPVWTIVCVKELLNQPYVLVGKDDTKPEDRVWTTFSGQSKDELLMYFDWMEEGKKLYQEKARSVPEMDGLRQVVLSVGVIGNLMNDNEFISGIYQAVIVRTAIKWFLNDHPDMKDDSEAVMSNKDFSPYPALVARYVTRLSEYVKSITSSVEAANKSK